ncbi:MAG: ATP-dependent helicase [Deltaproteobacteria bacterium]|nr:ATP-dependent helicase [Deltaproteobacteria bacterium]MCX7953049.1 ATP-dependent helicase [Deltaproteobacteria bacterium]
MLGQVLSTLNDEQLNAVLAPDGPVLVVAGAGSGKTRVLIARLLYLIQEKKVAPHRVVGITFSTQAANEMKERVVKLIGDTQIFLGTFHSFSLRILRNYAERLGYKSNFSVLDEEDSSHILKSVCKSLGSNYLKMCSEIGRDIDYMKNMGFTYQQCQSDLVRTVWEKYQGELLASNSMDFGDLLVNCKELLVKFQEVRHSVSKRIDHILVDEVQDTNLVQYELIKLLSRPPHNIFLVGDEDQSIYSFRGARYQNIQDFCKDFNVKNIYRLERNYRSSQEILAVANALISHNTQRHEKTLYSTVSNGIKPTLKTFFDEEDEANFIADCVMNLYSQGKTCAVFYRTNSLSRALEEAFIKKNVPYRIVGGIRFFERREIKDLIAWLRFFRNPQDVVAFSRILTNFNFGIGKATLEKIMSRATEQNFLESLKNVKPDVFDFISDVFSKCASKPYTLLRLVIEKSGYMDLVVSKLGKDRLDNVIEFMGFAKRYEDEGKDVNSLLDQVSLLSEIRQENVQGQVPVLMTLHMSKGLEFDCVFICGFEEGLIPHAFSRTEEEVEEERRLMYVGITRARQVLYITCAYSRSSYFGYSREISRFCGEIPYSLLNTDQSFDYHQKASSTLGVQEGSVVEHYQRGVGKVIKVLSENRCLVEFGGSELAFVNSWELKNVD